MFKSTDCILIMGQRGCGKSYLAKNLQSLWPRKIIIDAIGDYDESHGKIFSDFKTFSDHLILLKKEKAKKFSLIYQFDVEKNVSNEELEQVLRLSYWFGNIQVIVEECHLFSSPHVLPHWLKNLALTGRHQNTSLMLTTQRPGELNKTLISQCNHIFCGRILEGNDLRYVSAFLGQDASRLANLDNRKFLYFSENGTLEVSNDI